MRQVDTGDIHRALLRAMVLADEVPTEGSGPQEASRKKAVEKPSHELVDGWLRLEMPSPARDLVARDLMGYLSYRNREYLMRLLDRLLAPGGNGKCVDLPGLWAGFGEQLLERRHAFFVRPELYEQWRRTFHDLDEDLPALCLLARAEARRLKPDDSQPHWAAEEVDRRQAWPSRAHLYAQLRDWHTFITGDDRQLAQELGKGVACQHLHLTGAYPGAYFWVGLMNGRYKIEESFKRLNEPERTFRYPALKDPATLRGELQRARAIRYLLFQFVEHCLKAGCGPQGLETLQHRLRALLANRSELLTRELSPEDRDARPARHELEELTEPVIRELTPRVEKWRAGWREKTDYAQELCISSLEELRAAICPPLLGERALLYLMLLYLWQLRPQRPGSKAPKPSSQEQEQERCIAQALWVYLQTKNTFLGVVQQQEGYSGFDYFEHTLRLGITPSNLGMESASWAWELGRFLQESRSVIKLELMSAPRENAAEYQTLFDTLADIQTTMSERLTSDLKLRHGGTRVGLIVHFIKGPGNPLSERENAKSNAYRIFHYGKRDEIRRQFQVLEQVRASLDPLAPRTRPLPEGGSGLEGSPVELCGIDTANRELYCPPEIFGPLYKEVSYWRMGRTFHVGEDFAHLVTGLRRIYEAMSFLHLRAGDRLGHCIALGMNPALWVHSNPTVSIHLLDLLDDSVFEWSVLQEFGEGSTQRLSELERRIARYSSDIFGVPINPDVLQRAWRQRARTLLRTGGDYGDESNIPRWLQLQGDIMKEATDPEKGPERHGTHNVIPSLADLNELAEEYGIAELVPPKEWPEDLATRILLEYLYDRHTIRRGIDLRPVDTLRELEHITCLQELLRKAVMAKGLTVESNPSSNWLIGGFERLYDVPGVRWSLLHPDFPMTINPDDPSTFSTSIENEYFYVFSCLLRGTDEHPGLSRLEALERIRRIRELGLESSFLQ